MDHSGEASTLDTGEIVSSSRRRTHEEFEDESRVGSEGDYTRGDPDLMVDLPPFPDTVAYEYGGLRYNVRVPEYTLVVADSGMDPWGATIRKASGTAYKLLWNSANRWRNLVAELAMRLAASEAEVVRLNEVIAEQDRTIEALRLAHP